MAEIAFDNSFARLPEDFFARVRPAQVPKPELIAVNAALAEQLGIDRGWLTSQAGKAMLSGNALPASAEPLAMVYAGHQFGGFSPQLGDGRAVLLGEIVAGDGTRYDIQLKGSGQTPFSRQGDGKSPLGPVIREYIVSEAMAALGLPTTRALAAMTTGETVYREEPLPGGILTRVAQSHVRVGTFEFFASRGQADDLRQLADYVIDRHYPNARESKNPYRMLLESVARRQADLIARWMQVGFIHGVMNTDNMQIAGETIDFGPCAFMEAFDPEAVFSAIDRQGRYAWGNQPGIGQWNITRLAEALLPLLADDEKAAVHEAEGAMAVYAPAFKAAFVSGFEAKLGLPLSPELRTETGGDSSLVDETLELMKAQGADFTLFFRHLTRVASGEPEEIFLSFLGHSGDAAAWLGRWRAVAEAEAGCAIDSGRLDGMRRSNPIFIPRNHRVERAIQGALRGDYEPFEQLTAVLARPYDEQLENADFERPAREEEIVRRTFCGT